MANRPEKKKFLELDGVRAFYNRHLDRITLTAKDEDLPQFSVVLKPGTPTEEQVREVMRREGLMGTELSLNRNAHWGIPPRKGAGPARVITVTSTHGGSGVTTAALGLARELTERGDKVLLIDGDFRDGQLRWLGLSRKSGNSSIIGAMLFVNKGTSMEERLKEVVHPSPLGDILYGPKHGAMTEDIKSDFLRDLLTAATNSYDTVVIDGSVADPQNVWLKVFAEFSTQLLAVERVPLGLRVAPNMAIPESGTPVMNKQFFGNLLPGGLLMAPMAPDGANSFYLAEYMQSLTFCFTGSDIPEEDQAAIDKNLGILLKNNYGGLFTDGGLSPVNRGVQKENRMAKELAERLNDVHVTQDYAREKKKKR